MSGTLARFQSNFLKELFDRGTTSARTVQPAFAVYRNTVMSACVEALEANFPSVVRLVGAEWFRAAARTYVEAEPPRDGRLLVYGESFANYLAEFGPARELPYLADVAWLDRFWIESHVAEDATAMDGAWLMRLEPEALGALRLRPHPAARWRWFEQAPIYSLWQRNRTGMGTLEDVRWQGEGALLTRPVDSVEWLEINVGGIAFLDACARGAPLAIAAGVAGEVQGDVDVAILLSQLLRAGALICSPQEENNS